MDCFVASTLGRRLGASLVCQRIRRDKPVTMKGTVTKIDWKNPHVYIYMDIAEASGQVVNWAFEGYPPNTLRRVGFSRDLLKVGDTISVSGWLARDGSKQFAGRELTWTDGKKFFIGPASN